MKIPMARSNNAAFVCPKTNVSKTSLSSSAAIGGVAISPRQDNAKPTPTTQHEPNLYNIPSNLSPIYQPLPLWLHILIGSTSLALMARRIITNLIQHGAFQIAITWRNIVLFLLRYATLWTVSTIAVQEGFYPPSRVTTEYLRDSNSLPSAFSNYQTVTPILPNDKPIGVHYLKYTNSNSSKFEAIQLHHGFGASSLSFLPILPSLADRLGAKVALAHDAPGFGFTDRPNADTKEGLGQYTTENSVGIGLALLDSVTMDTKNVESGGNEVNKVAIFGHSMGTKAALLTALSSEKKIKLRPTLVVLVAPALEGLTLPLRRRKVPMAEIPNELSGFRRYLASVWIVLRKLFVDYPFGYLLKRLVGTKNFWKKGLSQAWGDPQRLTNSDVLRFQWPSIGKGWERGLLSFSRAIQSSDDGELLRRVVNLPHTSVVIVYGSRDRVVRVDEKVLSLLKSEFPEVKVVRMEGLGHDPFEEDKEAFLLELEKVLQAS